MLRLIEALYNEDRHNFEVGNFLSVRDKAIAHEWEGHDEKEIVKAAKEGDKSAVNYLFLKSAATIYKTFKQNYCYGSSDAFRRAVNNGEYEEWVADAYSMLINGITDTYGDNYNPLRTFKPEVYTEGSIITKFNYYYMQYLKTLADKKHDEYNAHGITNHDTDEIGQRVGRYSRKFDGSVNSLDIDSTRNSDRGDANNTRYADTALNDAAEFNGTSYSMEDEITNKIENEEFFESFRGVLEDPEFDETVKKCVKAVITNPNGSIEDAAHVVFGTNEELGMDRIAFHNKYGLLYKRIMQKKLPQILENNGIDLSDFIKVISSNDKYVLEDMLK